MSYSVNEDTKIATLNGVEYAPKVIENEIIALSQEECLEIKNHNDTYVSSGDALEDALFSLRNKRNNLLAQTDYLALSDQTMTAEMTAYRQALRDITNGLTTVADVEAVVFPTKPEV